VPGPPPAVARIRRAVRGTLAECSPGDLVLVALSGGADSTALAAAAAFEGPAVGVRVGAVVVDHGLLADSAEVARGAADRALGLGLDPVDVVTVEVSPTGGGVEAAAREARHVALTGAADRHAARLVLLGHTLDDQAEQVLLGLARGSGARSLAGMQRARDRFRRPLLGIRRSDTRSACTAAALPWWDDPMNEDPAFARVRARRALADLEADLGPGLAEALARTADQLRSDADQLDAEADAAFARLGSGPDAAVDDLAALPPAIRSRVWRRLLLAAGAPAGQLASRHTDECDRLLTDWHGQGPLHVPGELRVSRRAGRVAVERPAPLQ
jgi:tRNA(Ile)-lysidine synthase